MLGPVPARCLSCASSHFRRHQGPDYCCGEHLFGVAEMSSGYACRGSQRSGCQCGEGHDNAVWLREVPVSMQRSFRISYRTTSSSTRFRRQVPMRRCCSLATSSPTRACTYFLDAYRLLDNPPAAPASWSPDAWNRADDSEGVQLVGALPHEQVLRLFRSARGGRPIRWSDPLSDRRARGDGCGSTSRRCGLGRHP